MAAKWGKIGAPKSAKRKAHLARIRAKAKKSTRKKSTRRRRR